MSAAAEVCCELVRDGPDTFTVVVLIFLALACIALTGFIILLLD